MDAAGRAYAYMNKDASALPGGKEMKMVLRWFMITEEKRWTGEIFSGSSRRDLDGGSLEDDGHPSASTGERIHLPARRINGIVLQQRGITAGIALRLERFFGNSAQFWIDLQTRYELESALEALTDGNDKVITATCGVERKRQANA